MFKNILVLTNGSQVSKKAIDKAVALAANVGARITGLTVVQPSHEPVGNGTLMLGGHVVEDAAHEFLQDVERAAAAAGVQATCLTVRSESPHSAAVAVAQDRGCDLICMGTHGRSQLGKIIFGSELTGVLHECDIPVLVYR